MKRFQRAIAGAGGVVLVLLALGAAAPYLVDGGTIRSQLFTKISGWADGRLQVNGPVYLTSLFDLTIEAHDIEIRAPARFANVESLRAERIEARLSLWDLLNKRISFEKMWMHGLRVALREEPSDYGARDAWRALVLNDPPLLDDILRAGKDAPFLTMVVRDAQFLSAATGEPVIAELGSYSGVVRRAPGGSEFSVDGRVGWGSERVDIELKRSRFTPEGPTHTARMRGAFESASLGRISIDGRIVRANGERFIGRFEVSEAPAQPVAALLDLPMSLALAQSRVSASGEIAATSREIALQQLQIGLGSAQATGLLRIDLSDRPRIAGTLGFGAVDLSVSRLSETLESGLLARNDLADAPIEGDGIHATALASVMRRFDADLRLSAESLLLDGVSTGPAAAFLSLTDGLAALDLAELMVFDGFVNGQFTGRWDNSRFTVSGKGRAENVELAQFLAGAGTVPLLTGDADISFTLGSSGASLHDLARQARLSGRLIAVDGGELALDVVALAAQRAQAGARHSAITPSRGEYDTLSCAFVFDGGRLDVHSLEIARDVWRIRGKGRIDLARQKLDWRFDAGQLGRQIEARALPPRDSALTPGGQDAIGMQVLGPMHDLRVIYSAPSLDLSDVRG